MISRETRKLLFLLTAATLVTTCSAPDTGSRAEAQSAAAQPATDEQQLACTPQRASVANRASPYDSVLITVGTRQAKICYGRPSRRGRTVFDSLVAYNQLWRTGANEPTIIHIPFAAKIAGMDVQPGSYSIYTIPVPAGAEWTVIVNRSISQWGEESGYTAEVQAQEVGRAPVTSAPITEHVEQFTIRSEPAGPNAANILLEWVNTRVTIPVTASGLND
jgi:hypothetical protein